jgi:glucosamine--fructose-6-phosphate aminotransferase (isomerizing)
MCGIFAYLNHGVVRKRSDLMAMLIGGLKRLEYRGYDSAGIAIDGDKNTPGFVYKIVYLIFFLFIFLKKFIN